MPRNLTSGVYAPPSGTYGVTGAIIDPVAYNAFVNDIGAEITNSIDARGETPMAAALNMGGKKVTNAANGVASSDLATVSQLSSAIPVGTIVAYATSAPPPGGWAYCNGAAISRSANPNLFSLIGTTFGAGDGSTTFNVPSIIDKTIVMFSNLFTFNQVGGEENHTLALAEIPNHNHGYSQTAHSHSDSGHGHSDTGHTHAYTAPVNGVTVTLGSSAYALGTTATATGTGYAAITTGYANIQAQVASISFSAQGGSGAHNNMQPFIALSYIIKIG